MYIKTYEHYVGRYRSIFFWSSQWRYFHHLTSTSLVPSLFSAIKENAIRTQNDEDSPRARYVLFKGLEGEGLIFHTNYQSSKAQEIKSNNEVAVVFYWREIHRQIRVEGIAEKAPKQISDSYFDTRPRGGQLSALASPQSKVIKSRKEIEKKIDKLDRKYGSKQINRPENWGGYIIQPIAWEFWQGRKNRTHDRFRYQRISSKWKINRLAPWVT